MCFVLQTINFLSHNTSLKNKNNTAYLKFVLAEFHTIFHNAAVLKNIGYWTKYHSFMEDIKMRMIHLHILEFCYFTNKKTAR